MINQQGKEEELFTVGVMIMMSKVTRVYDDDDVMGDGRDAL